MNTLSSAAARRVRLVGMDVDGVLTDNGVFIGPIAGERVERRGIAWEEVAFVGDDLADLPVLRRVGLPIAVANAVPDVKAAAAHVTKAAGGHGAVREVVEALLRARGEWPEILARYFTEQVASVA